MVRTCNAAIAFVAMASAALAGASAIVPPAGAPRLQGEVAPPQGELSLWYREPAADRPTTPRPPPGRHGRVGSRAAGRQRTARRDGVRRRRQRAAAAQRRHALGGGPYDPVNPEAKDALPEVRRLLAVGDTPTPPRWPAESDGEAAGADAVPDGRRSQLTFPATRRRRGITGAISISPRPPRASRYTVDDVTFTREVFASAPDQVIVVRLTASRPGRISFEARLRTPQRATVEATDRRRSRDARRQRRRPRHHGGRAR